MRFVESFVLHECDLLFCLRASRQSNNRLSSVTMFSKKRFMAADDMRDLVVGITKCQSRTTRGG
jgi:hypothetical protein